MSRWWLDGNLVSSRTPLDLPHFAKAMVQFLETTREPSSRQKLPRHLPGKASRQRWP